MRKFSSFSPRCPCWRRNTWKSCLKTASNSTQLSFVMASPTRTSLPEITMINQFKRSISLNLIARKVLRRLDFWYERKKVCSISYKKNCRAQIDQAYAGNGLSTECCVPSMSRSIRQVYCHFGCCACRWWRHRLMSHSSAQKSIWGGCVCFYRKRLYSSAHIAWATSTAKGKISDFFDPPPTVSNEFYAFLIQCLVASFECVSVWGLFTIPVREREREKKLYTHLGPPKLTFSLTPDHCLISFEQPRIHTRGKKWIGYLYYCCWRCPFKLYTFRPSSAWTVRSCKRDTFIVKNTRSKTMQKSEESMLAATIRCVTWSIISQKILWKHLS